MLNANEHDTSATSTDAKSALSIEWLGQTLASLCWIISVFVYESNVGLWSTGDWLQLGAASCWMVANVATLVSNKA